MSTQAHFNLGPQVTLVDPRKRSVWVVTHIDPHLKSVWLANGTRLGFAAARRRGIDPETLQVEHPELVGDLR